MRINCHVCLGAHISKINWDDISYHHTCMSSGSLSWRWHITWMSYCNVIKSSGWHTLQLLSHADETENFDFSWHVVALQHIRTKGPCGKTTIENEDELLCQPTQHWLTGEALTDTISIMFMSYKAEHSWRWDVLIICLKPESNDKYVKQDFM